MTTIKVPIWLAVLWMLFFAACFLCIPVIVFYVAPKCVVWAANWLIHVVGIRYTLPFNVITWALSMYLLWVLGIVKFTVRETKSLIDKAKVA